MFMSDLILLETLGVADRREPLIADTIRRLGSIINTEVELEDPHDCIDRGLLDSYANVLAKNVQNQVSYVQSDYGELPLREVTRSHLVDLASEALDIVGTHSKKEKEIRLDAIRQLGMTGCPSIVKTVNGMSDEHDEDKYSDHIINEFNTFFVPPGTDLDAASYMSKVARRTMHSATKKQFKSEIVLLLDPQEPKTRLIHRLFRR